MSVRADRRRQTTGSEVRCRTRDSFLSFLTFGAGPEDPAVRLSYMGPRVPPKEPIMPMACPHMASTEPTKAQAEIR